MTNVTTPYLCGGTFLTQLLRARHNLTTAADHIHKQRENLSEQETFRKLISIYQLNDFWGGTSLKTYTSKYKSCTDSLTAFAQFSDSDLRLAFDIDVRSESSTALKMMSDFVSEFINIKDKGVQLVRCLLGIIKDDTSIPNNDSFYIKIGEAVTKAELIDMDTFTIESFLLGVWHYIIMNRADKNKKGADTYKSWYVGRGNYCGTVGNDIIKAIKVESVPTLLSNTEAKGEQLILPSNTLTSTERVYSEEDEQLLKEFTGDYDELVMKCIGANFADFIVDELLFQKITSLYNNKWCSKADEFENLSLKPNIWALLNYLNELCKKHNPELPSERGLSIRQIQTKLRNLYVKLHPNNYANVFLYDAIYDDWNLGEDY